LENLCYIFQPLSILLITTGWKNKMTWRHLKAWEQFCLACYPERILNTETNLERINTNGKVLEKLPSFCHSLPLSPCFFHRPLMSSCLCKAPSAFTCEDRGLEFEALFALISFYPVLKGRDLSLQRTGRAK
jgi:hypothetical protein